MADTDFLERTVHIPEAKGDKFRTVPFTERTLFWLEAYLSMRGKKSEYLFCNEDGDKIGYQAMGQYFQYISVKVKFRLHAHMLRHTAGRLWAEAGINQGLICRFMGHETTTMTNQYIHTSAKKLKELQNTVYQNNLFLSVKV